MSFSYANPTSGPSAGGIGWFTFGNLTLNPGDSLTQLTGVLNNGNVVSFDLSLSLNSGVPRTFVATQVPIYSGANFGTTGYTGITGNAALHANYNLAGPGINTLTLSNITVKTPGGNPVPNYTVVVADAETTNTGEVWSWNTNGGVWNLLATLGGNPPVLTGLGTQIATITGNQLFPQASQAANILTTQAPTQLNLVSTETASGRQGISIGFATTRVSLQKNIGQRIDTSDQFDLSITGTPTNQVTTAGGVNGVQSAFAQIYANPNTSYNINETMASGSTSILGDYKQIVSASNTTPAGSIPLTGLLPISFTPKLGDDVTYTILNAAPEIFIKTVDKAYVDVGELLTYTLTVENPNNFAINNVQVVDATPAGTIYIGGSLSVSAPYTGTDLDTGITITIIGPDEVVVIQWQVQVNTFPPIPNPVPNYANVIVPGGTSGMSNIVTTQVNTAYVTVNKLVDKFFGKPGEVLTYTLLVNNAGNVSANNVVLTDAIPAGTTLIPGSITGATGIPPVLTITNPIPAGGNAAVTFQVKVNGIPLINPIQNFASLSYTYTVDPTNPNGKTGTRKSNTVVTEISIASLTTTKAVDKHTAYLGDTITYQLAVVNTGNIPANNVVLTDLLPSGVSYLPGTLIVNVLYSGTLTSTIQLTNPIAPTQTVTLSFQVKVTEMPNPNPIINQATVNYTYTTNPQNTNGEPGLIASNKVCTLVFRYKYNQQISDLIKSVALEQAALGAIANAEGAKIQKMVAMGKVSTQQLLCLNKSVSDMMNSIATLEAVLKQKLNLVSCQINGCDM